MATTLNSSGITFPNGTTQTTAASGAPTDLYAIGTYVIAMVPGTNYSVNNTRSGAGLYACSAATELYNNGYGEAWPSGSLHTNINTGSWRCVSPSSNNKVWGYDNLYRRQAGLWVRYA